MMNYDFDDSGSLGYCSDPQFSPDNNIIWAQPDLNSATWVEFTEQPADYRYRYLKEKYHGHIVGVSSPATKKKDLCKFPKLKLHNYNGSAIVRVWLISTELDKPRAHFHKLARKPPKGSLSLEPHDFKASSENNYEVTLDYLHIVHAVSNDENDINVYRKKKAHIDSGCFDPPRMLPVSSRNEKEEIKQIDKNQSVFYVEVFDENTHMKVCESIVSNKIKNLHNAETGALKIVNCSRTFGSCRGNDEVFIFVEKISKDVQVRFFSLNNNKERIWEACAIYGPQHVHHQLGIVFRTPKFKEDIDKDVQVFFELHRTNDGAVSEPYSFTYKPHEDYTSRDVTKKRPHSPENVYSEELYVPTPVSAHSSKRIKDESMSPDSTTLIQTVTESSNLDYGIINYLEGDDINNLLNSISYQNELDLNNTSIDFLGTNESTLLYSDLNLSENSPLLALQSDCVSSSEENTEEDSDTNHLPHAQEDNIRKPESAIDDNNQDHFAINSTSEKKRDKKFSHSTKMVLLTAISQKKPIDEFNKILQEMTDINTVDYEGNAALHYAVRSSIEYLEPILNRTDVNKKLKNLWGDDALLDATRNGEIDIVRLLLKKGFDPNVQNSRTGETPLHIAVCNQNVQLIELLLKHGSDPLLGNHGDKSAYEYSMYCSLEVRQPIQFLMQKSMFQKKKQDCSNEASLENELVSKLNGLAVTS